MMNDFQNHVDRMQKGLHHAREIYYFLGARWSVTPQIFLWRLRYRAIYLFSMAGLWLSEHPKNSEFGGLIAQWREAHKNVGAIVTRNIIGCGVTTPTFTRAMIELRCGGKAKPTAIKAVIKTGIDLGLITSSDCCKDHYRLTGLCIDQAFDRTIYKLLTPEILEFAEFIVMWHQMRKNAELVGTQEESKMLGYGEWQTVSEEIYYNSYDKYIFKDDGR